MLTHFYISLKQVIKLSKQLIFNLLGLKCFINIFNFYIYIIMFLVNLKKIKIKI